MGSLSLKGFPSISGDAQYSLSEAVHVYAHAITRMRSLIWEIRQRRHDHQLTPARKIWQLGNVIFELREALQQISLEIDGMYAHLMRDLCVKRKWLEKVIIFRRYVAQEELIPPAMNWGRFAKGPRQAVQELLTANSGG